MTHFFKLNQYYIAVDGNSGSIHELDEVSFTLLKPYEKMPLLEDLHTRFGDQYDYETIRNIHSEIKSLVEQNLLYTEEKYLLEVISDKKINHSMKAICLHIAHDCNLKCKYCFAAEGDYKTGKKLMSLEIAKKSVDYLIANSKGRKKLEIDFFGGEPLLNFDVVKETVLYAKSLESIHNKSFYFTITTNGVLLTEEISDFINDNMDNIVISIDGRRETHDAIRFDLAGNGSYSRIVPKAQKLLSNRKEKSYFVRGTFTRENMDFSKDVMHLADLGFKEISVEPVVGTGMSLHFAESDIDIINAEYENLALQYISRLEGSEPFRFYHFNINIFDGPCVHKRITACGAGSEYFAISPEGDLYPCHQFVGEEDFLVGNVFDGITNHKLGETLSNTSVLTKDDCKKCWAKLFCSGGCHANAFFSNGSIDKPNSISCALQRKRIECAIMIQLWKNENSHKIIQL